MRALVVDDSKPSRSIVARALRELRFECDEAANGAEAIARLAAGPRPDLVTVNWHMPVMDGIELLRRLRGHPRHRDLKLLMISTESDRGRIEMALAAGADDFVSKPFTAEALARTIEWHRAWQDGADMAAVSLEQIEAFETAAAAARREAA